MKRVLIAAVLSAAGYSVHILAAMLSTVAFSLHASISNDHHSVFAEKYEKTVPVVSELSQVVYYRERTTNAQSITANLYVDGQYHTSLLPGGYTAFCLAPGQHTFGSNLRANTLNQINPHDTHAADLAGGKTYFVRVSEDGRNLMQHQQRSIAEKALQKSLRQAHLLSRATAVMDCVFDPEREQTARNYAIDTELLFGYHDYNNSQITRTGREALSTLALTIRDDLSRINLVTIVSGTGARVMPEVTDKVKLQRAEAIRSHLVANAIPSQFIQIIPSAESAVVSAECITSESETGQCKTTAQQVFVFAK